MFQRRRSRGNPRRRFLLQTIVEAVALLAAVTLPAAAVYQTARQANVARILSGPGETLAGFTPAGTHVSVTSYAATPEPPPPGSAHECPALLAHLDLPCPPVP